MKHLILLLSCICCSFLSLNAQDNNSKKSVDTVFTNLKWRNIGPFRGGRSVASCGVVGQPMTYYMGSTGGGVFKTEDDGITWKNVSDGFFKTGTVGAIAVSESNPNIVFVGMGEHAARGVMTSMGDGVYKSTDAGKTWSHMGLDFTRHISDVIIHPSNPDIVFVAAQGAQFGPSEDRGIYKSTDGGKTWNKTLYVNETTGASSLSMDFKNPLILYASMWEHKRFPWQMESGGAGSGLYKSNDGGETWKPMKKGLPAEFGKSGISVSRANPNRVFAVIEAEGTKGGVYRSDNAGDNWKQINKDRVNIARSWYYMEIFADPQNENTVYVLNAPVMKSIDGGKTFKNIPVPHGDNHHLWIHPHNNQIMINSNDGGANVSNNGGKSWSTQKNQATSQFYRVITDNLFPYNVYGGQQDNSAIAIASRTNDAGIDWKDWYSVAGCESAFLAFDPDNPEVVYGGCYQGIIDRWVKDANESKIINEYPEQGLSKAPKDAKYRFNWNAPIVSDPFDRSIIYHAGNKVFKTSDGGISWSAISPDLTRNETEKHGPGGAPYTNEAAGGENYNTIMSFVVSPQEKGVFYVGTDDGLVHITKNGGLDWENITPKGIGSHIINTIEISPHDPATAYIAVMGYKSMDLKPYIFKTTNYGKNWTKINNGISGDHTFVRVVREDKKRKGLLYAGTETGLYISWNDGVNWQPFQLNLPVVPINDLTIQDNDLIAATAGRSFWILDDLGSIQSKVENSNKLTLVKPKDTYLFFGGKVPAGNGLGENPSSGVIIDYYIPKVSDSLELSLEILQNGKTIRTFKNKMPKGFKTWMGGPPKPSVLPAKQGYNRFVWNFRKETLPAIDNLFVFGDYRGGKVSPGTYTLQLKANDEVVNTSVTINANPKINTTPSQYAEKDRIVSELENMITEIHTSVNTMRSVKSQLKHYKDLLKDNETAEGLLKQGDSLMKRITSWEENLAQTKQKTFQDVINFNNKLNSEILYLKDFVDSNMPQVTKGSKERLQDLKKDWNTYKTEMNVLVNTEMKAYNEAFKKLELPALLLKE